LIVDVNQDNSIILELYYFPLRFLCYLLPLSLFSLFSFLFSFSLSLSSSLPLLSLSHIFSIVCRPNGRVFIVPAENVELSPSSIPKQGDVVTFSHDVSSRRLVPMNPKIFRIRSDVSWEDVLAQHAREVQVLSLNGM
jgi:hypothetical protein